MESMNGKEMIKIKEKLPNPASIFTSWAEMGIFRSQSLNRSTESSCGATEFSSRIARRIRGISFGSNTGRLFSLVLQLLSS
jgi:hypothetical protein